ncbi:MAG: hypothetical protein JSV49_08780 [Thermoplasmata archaeon]|nr:MAG: hypothetical protein JSV49_08780 [Thermoplasmata archaeon]
MAKKDANSEKSDAEKTLISGMAEVEKVLNTMAEKMEQKRKEIEKKGLDATVKDTAEKVKVGSKAIMDEVHEDAKKLKKNIEEMLKDL